MAAESAGAAAGGDGDGVCGGERDHPAQSEYAPLQRFIDEFWQRNQMEQRIPEWCDELCRAGEIFPVLFTNPQDRTSTVRCVPASIVERIEWREGDYEAELRYKEVGLAGGADERGGCRRCILTPPIWPRR